MTTLPVKDQEKTWNKADPDITYSGTMITLPDNPARMPIPFAIEALQRKQKDEETILKSVEFIDAHPMDGAVAFMQAMKQIYGWASPMPTPGFWGPSPPQLLTVETGPNAHDTVQVLWGSFKLPNVENLVQTVASKKDGRPVLYLVCDVRKREQYILKELASLTREILKTSSIYKGKAIRLKVRADGTINETDAPTFLPTDYITTSDLILNEVETAQVGTSLWTPIIHTEACRAARIPLKRGILLEGPYGTGKTMTANITAAVCVKHGWTFILLDDCGALKDALLLANRYAPAVIFAEDIDRVAEKRDQRGNDLLNTIDGILSKDAQVITVLTTNFVEKINRAMLRPGRLDAVISIRPPGEEAVQKLIRLYARDLLAPDSNLTSVGTELAGNIPATIREVVERAKLGMISRGDTKISAGDLLYAAKGMQNHLRLLEEKAAEPSVGERLASNLKAIVGNPLANGQAEDFNLVKSRVKEIHEAVVE